MFLGQHDFVDGAGVDGEGLEELRAGADGLRVLHDDAHRARASAVRDLDPVPDQACNTPSAGWPIESVCAHSFPSVKSL